MLNQTIIQGLVQFTLSNTILAFFSGFLCLLIFLQGLPLFLGAGVGVGGIDKIEDSSSRSGGESGRITSLAGGSGSRLGLASSSSSSASSTAKLLLMELLISTRTMKILETVPPP